MVRWRSAIEQLLTSIADERSRSPVGRRHPIEVRILSQIKDPMEAAALGSH
jgi:hypothetical protein